MSSTYRPPLQAVRPTGYRRVDHRCGNVVIRFERKTFVVIRGREYRHLRPMRWKFTLLPDQLNWSLTRKQGG